MGKLLTFECNLILPFHALLMELSTFVACICIAWRKHAWPNISIARRQAFDVDRNWAQVFVPLFYFFHSSHFPPHERSQAFMRLIIPAEEMPSILAVSFVTRRPTAEHPTQDTCTTQAYPLCKSNALKAVLKRLDPLSVSCGVYQYL